MLRKEEELGIATRIQYRSTPIALIALALVWSGCATTQMRLYDGPARESAEVAVLKVQWEVFEPSARIKTVDGTPVEKGPARIIKEAELLPGTHTLEVGYFYQGVKSIQNATLTFTAKAGGIYELHVAPVDEGFGKMLGMEFGARGHWTVWIVDADSKEVLAGTPRTKPLRWYE
jgi:hypothetical protein